MNAQQKISRLQPLLEQAEKHYTSTRREPGFIVWREHLVETFELLFGSGSSQSLRVRELTFNVLRRVDGTPTNAFRRAAALKRDLDLVVALLKRYIEEFHLESLEESQDKTSPLAYLHHTVQHAAGSRFASAHYSDAISAACTALDKAVAAKAQRPDLNGKQLMDVAFTPRNPLVRLSQNDNEQTGFMLLYQGVMQAIRNHYAHNLTEVPAARALEWLSLISALFYKLDEATVTPTAQ